MFCVISILGSSSSEAMCNIPVITQLSCSTNQSGSASPISENNNTMANNRLRVKLEREKNAQKRTPVTNDTLVNNRRGDL